MDLSSTAQYCSLSDAPNRSATNHHPVSSSSVTSVTSPEAWGDRAGMAALSAMLEASQSNHVSMEDIQRSFVHHLVNSRGEAEASSLALILLEALGAARACSVAAEAMGRLDQAALGASTPVPGAQHVAT